MILRTEIDMSNNNINRMTLMHTDCVLYVVGNEGFYTITPRFPGGLFTSAVSYKILRSCIYVFVLLVPYFLLHLTQNTKVSQL
jgi:hypothetical protein